MDVPTNSPRLLSKALTTVLGFVALLAITATSAYAVSSVATMTEIEVSNGAMSSGASEWSGATHNANRNVLLVVDDEHNAYEFQLKADGSINHGEPVRVLTLSIGANDFEGIAWLNSERYALLSEGTGMAYIVDIPTATNTVTQSDIVSQFNAGGPDGNTGSEGIAIDGDGNYYVTDEMPASISKYTSAGVFVAEVLLPELGDATGVAVAEDNSYLVISHESSKANHYEIDWTAGTRTQIGSIDLSSFSQLEGIAMIDNDHLHIFGEQKGGQTYSHMVGDIVEIPTYALADVNCSGLSDVIDALIITKIEVGTGQATAGCGTGDSNNDGNVNVVDALIITQCNVGIVNDFCNSMTTG